MHTLKQEKLGETQVNYFIILYGMHATACHVVVRTG